MQHQSITSYPVINKYIQYVLNVRPSRSGPAHERQSCLFSRNSISIFRADVRKQCINQPRQPGNVRGQQKKWHLSSFCHTLFHFPTPREADILSKDHLRHTASFLLHFIWWETLKGICQVPLCDLDRCSDARSKQHAIWKRSQRAGSSINLD